MRSSKQTCLAQTALRMRPPPRSIFHIIAFANHWKGCTPRLSLVRLSSSKNGGGIGLPNFKRYHKASLLTRVVDWHIHEKFKDWINLEKPWAKGALLYVVGLPYNELPSAIKSHPLIRPTIQCLGESVKLTSISSIPGPMTLIKNNAAFPPESDIGFLRTLAADPHPRAYQFFTQGVLCTKSELTSKEPDLPLPTWSYLQARHFLDDPRTREIYDHNLTAFEKLCISSPPQKHLMSNIYSILTNAGPDHISSLSKYGKRDKQTLSPNQIRKTSLQQLTKAH